MIKRHQRLSNIQWNLLTFMLCAQNYFAYYVTEFNAKIYEPAENDPGSIFNEANEKQHAVYRLLSGPYGKEEIYRSDNKKYDSHIPNVNLNKRNYARNYQKGASLKWEQKVDTQNINDIYQRILRNILRNETTANGRLKPANYLSTDDKQSYRRHRPPYVFDETKLVRPNSFKYGKFDFSFDHDYSSDVFPKDRQHSLGGTFNRKWREDMFNSVPRSNDNVFKDKFSSQNQLDEQVNRIDDIEKWNLHHRSKPTKYKLNHLPFMDNESSHHLTETKYDHTLPNLMTVMQLPSSPSHTNSYYYKETANKNKYTTQKVLNSYRNIVSSANPSRHTSSIYHKRSVQDQLNDLKNDSYGNINSSTTQNKDLSDAVRNRTSNESSNFADEKIDNTKLSKDDRPMETYNGTILNATRADITKEIDEKETFNESNFSELTTKTVTPNENKSYSNERDPSVKLSNDREELDRKCQQHHNDANTCVPISDNAEKFKPNYFSRLPVTGFLIMYIRDTEIVQPIYISKFQHDFVTDSTEFKDNSNEVINIEDNSFLKEFNISTINALVPDNVTSTSSKEEEIDNNLSQAIYHDIFDNSAEQRDTDNQTIINDKKDRRNNRVDKTYLYYSNPDRILGNVLNYLTYVQPPVEQRIYTEYYDLNILSKHENNNFTIID